MNCKISEPDLTVVKRDGALVPFHRQRIEAAIEAAFRDTKGIETAKPLPSAVRSTIEEVSQGVIAAALDLAAQGKSLTVEGLQDLAEETLMRLGHYGVARDYIIYRNTHKAWREESPHNLKIKRRDGNLVRFNPMKIASSLERFLRAESNENNGLSPEMVALINSLTQQVVAHGVAQAKEGITLEVSDIEETIEQQLMAGHFYALAKAYILRRSSSPERRRKPQPQRESTSSLERVLSFACRGLDIPVGELLEEALQNRYEGIPAAEFERLSLFAARSKIERHPAYSQVAARLLSDLLYKEVLGVEADDENLEETQRNYFCRYIETGIASGHLAEEMGSFDLPRLAAALQSKRDDKFQYIGLQTLYDRYLLSEGEKRLETPQILWMRVAMGIALAEKKERSSWAIKFYEMLSTFRYMAATPTLFNAGTPHPQLSSCYLSTIEDSLEGIFKGISDDALLSKWAGGLGNDWSQVRAAGAPIKGTRGASQGVIPFLKVANDTAVAVNQGGKRKGAMCAYLETWHLDIEEFLELRKNTGDERRRTHDMNTANWIPDLFMKRVANKELWTLFSPDQVADLHELYGQAFEKRYLEYETTCSAGIFSDV